MSTLAKMVPQKIVSNLGALFRMQMPLGSRTTDSVSRRHSHFQNESPVLELGFVIGIGTAPGFEVHFIIIWLK